MVDLTKTLTEMSQRKRISLADISLDLVDAETLKRVKGIVRSFNPTAELIEATNSRIDVQKIVNTGKFDYENAKLMPGWLKSLQEMIEVDVAGQKRMAPLPETLE